jgi:hypothetical protein
MPRTKRFVMLAPLVVLTLVVGPAVLAAPVVVFASTAVAAKNPVGSPGWCAHHPKAAKKVPACSTSGGGGPPAIRVQVDPNPTVETDQGLVVAVIQVAASPSFAGDAVEVSSSQLLASCGGALFFLNFQNGGTPSSPNIGIDDISAVLDADGNATVVVDNEGCAPGSDLIEADLVVAPYLTATTVLAVDPPTVTPAGVVGSPATSGTIVGETATGDTTDSGDSAIYGVFTVETDPVNAGLEAEIGSAQLESRCVGGWFWGGTNGSITGTGPNPGAPLQSPLDDDGNTTFLFMGVSCAAGSSQVVADVLGGTAATYTTTFVVDAPAPTI